MVLLLQKSAHKSGRGGRGVNNLLLSKKINVLDKTPELWWCRNPGGFYCCVGFSIADTDQKIVKFTWAAFRGPCTQHTHTNTTAAWEEHAPTACPHWDEHSSWDAETSFTGHFQPVSPLTKSQGSATQCSHPVCICVGLVFRHEKIKLLKANIKSFNMITLRFSLSCLRAIIKTCLRDKINP